MLHAVGGGESRAPAAGFLNSSTDAVGAALLNSLAISSSERGGKPYPSCGFINAQCICAAFLSDSQHIPATAVTLLLSISTSFLFS
jgi:hypothetical protein